METVKRRGGAPKKTESEKRDRRVEIAFTLEEFTQLLKRKRTTKVPNLSTFVRMVCLDKPLRMKPQLTTHQETALGLLRETRADILRIGINVNQAARHINNTTDYQNLQHEVNRMAEQLALFDGQMGRLMTQLDADSLLTQTGYGHTD